MWRGLPILLLLSVSPAHADEDDLGVRAKTTWRHEGPSLTLDPILRPASQGLGGIEEGERTDFSLGPRARAMTQTSWWKNELDVAAQGWRAELRFEYDAGFATFGVSGSMNHLDSRYDRGTYRDLSLYVGRRFKLSRWMTAWIMLSVGQRVWLGEKTPEHPAEVQTQLSIGTTFR